MTANRKAGAAKRSRRHQRRRAPALDPQQREQAERPTRRSGCRPLHRALARSARRRRRTGRTSACWPTSAPTFSRRFTPVVPASTPPHASTTMPSGMLTANSQGQLATARIAPQCPGPAAEAIGDRHRVEADDRSEQPLRHRRSAGSSAASAMIAPPPRPCTNRASHQHRQAAGEGAAAEARVKSATPARNTRRGPSISPIDAAGQQRDQHGKLVARTPPRPYRRAGVERGGDRGQRDIGDGAVEHHQDQRQQQDGDSEIATRSRQAVGWESEMWQGEGHRSSFLVGSTRDIATV